MYRIIAYYIDINTDIGQFVTELRKGRIKNKKTHSWEILLNGYMNLLLLIFMWWLRTAYKSSSKRSGELLLNSTCNRL